MNDGDAKRYLREDLLVYSGLFLFTLAFDFLVNLAIACHLHNAPHTPQGHPYSYGAIQLMFMGFCAVQFFRKLADWKYYAD